MSLFTLQPDGPATHFTLSVTPDLCVGVPELRFMFGGTVLGAAIAAIERAAARPIIYATAQFLSQAGPHSLLEIDVSLGTVGRFITQAQATGRVGERIVFIATAALGARPHALTTQWVSPPAVLPPDQSVEDIFWPETARMLKEKIDIRHAVPAGAGTAAAGQAGRMLLWIRTREDVPLDASLLAIFADFTTAAVTDTLGRGFVGNSLDNTIRISRIVPSRWILCEVALHGAHAGFAHGDMRMFAKTGELLAIAGQSMILRPRPDVARPVPSPAAPGVQSAT